MQFFLLLNVTDTHPNHWPYLPFPCHINCRYVPDCQWPIPLFKAQPERSGGREHARCTPTPTGNPPTPGHRNHPQTPNPPTLTGWGVKGRVLAVVPPFDLARIVSSRFVVLVAEEVYFFAVFIPARFFLG